MNLSERLFETTAEARDQATAYVARAADAARASADRAANQVAAARTPVEVLTDATLKLNALSHDYFARLLARQGAMLKGTLTEGEKRLHRLARAASLQQALAGQAEDLNEIPPRVARNARETWDIVAETGRGVAQLATRTYAELVQGAAAPRTRKKTPASRARKAARKSATSRARSKTAKAA